MDNNRKRKKSRGGDNRKVQQQQTQAPQQTRKHMVFDELDVPQVNEPKPLCHICGQTIDFIAEAISESDGFGTISSGSTRSCVPRPLHVGQAP